MGVGIAPTAAHAVNEPRSSAKHSLLGWTGFSRLPYLHLQLDEHVRLLFPGGSHRLVHQDMMSFSF
jgi:hypothetical protein